MDIFGCPKVFFEDYFIAKLVVMDFTSYYNIFEKNFVSLLEFGQIKLTMENKQKIGLKFFSPRIRELSES